MFSHHSHSGDYISHGVDTLDAIVEEVQRRGFHTYCLTEHMPRLEETLLYPEERTTDSLNDLKRLRLQFQKYLEHSQRIKKQIVDVNLIVGMEVEGCNSKHIGYARDLMDQHKEVLKFCVGSIHHVNDIPIDYNQALWFAALESSGNNLRKFLLDYFELQYDMLKTLKPKVVGHFDLIRLFMPEDGMFVDKSTGEVAFSATKDDLDLGTWTRVMDISPSLISIWSDVEAVVIRNIAFINSYKGLIEINSSGIRKGLVEPYPHRDVANLVKKYANSRFVLSDDAHSVAQVGVAYNKTLQYIEHVLQLQGIYYLSEIHNGAELDVKYMSLGEIKANSFWKSN
ncbi:histidinol-phosphatase Ecym_2752 [Eremothecium cymbalariae DBVPG|uniref:Histidinol-phosphatase n=1 Tax=Eremothecium cymbalariae (strain CBS 270.75 / DBVPG 7215 / KCTC 17166 / NRRL Y-17582) TaxID=931890 RepID=G8JPY8_ERECY|nr:Hypothetical protein Ecym_2752 [Eremothecium cymbalariae DBVPG\